MKIGKGNRSIRRKPASAPLCPPQISLDQTRDRTRAAAVWSQRLTAWAMARPLSKLLKLFLQYIDVLLRAVGVPRSVLGAATVLCIPLLSYLCPALFRSFLSPHSAIWFCNNWLLHINLREYLLDILMLLVYCFLTVLTDSYSFIAYLCIYLTDRKVTG
jgi:hypothetical protein